MCEGDRAEWTWETSGISHWARCRGRQTRKKKKPLHLIGLIKAIDEASRAANKAHTQIAGAYQTNLNLVSDQQWSCDYFPHIIGAATSDYFHYRRTSDYFLG